jgi:hypothetical protein
LETKAKSDKMISRALLEFFRENWIGGTGVAPDDPRLNLLHADLAGLPRSISITAQTSCSSVRSPSSLVGGRQRVWMRASMANPAASICGSQMLTRKYGSGREFFVVVDDATWPTADNPLAQLAPYVEQADSLGLQLIAAADIRSWTFQTVVSSVLGRAFGVAAAGGDPRWAPRQRRDHQRCVRRAAAARQGDLRGARLAAGAAPSTLGNTVAPVPGRRVAAAAASASGLPN